MEKLCCEKSETKKEPNRLTTNSSKEIGGIDT